MSAASQARSVYRALYRASNTTFGGDIANQTKFRALIRETFLSPTLTPASLPVSKEPPPCLPCQAASTSTSPAESTPSPTPEPVESVNSTPEQMTLEEYQGKLQHWREVAEIIQRNVVQGSKIEEASGEDEAAYKLRITRHTELGDNNTIKSPPKLPTTPFPNRPRRRARRQEATDGA